ncbi:MAG: class I SAM-dependent methyltransferase [Hyphomicrobiaceae bacterium]
MSGFAPEWLALREGADHRSINHVVRRALLAHVSRLDVVRIADLGCGTGSNFRSLAPEIAAKQAWQLIDHDPQLLQLASVMTADQARTSQAEVRVLETDLATGNLDNIASQVDLVTAAALFDLISADVIDKLVRSIAAAGCAFYTVLTYDGIATWLPETPINATLREAFNRHQQTDKGFGPAAGPTATDVLASAFAGQGYRVVRGKSPWILDAGLSTLRHETDRGWAGAVAETDALTSEECATWLKEREAAPSAVTIVGHEDLLALPPA